MNNGKKNMDDLYSEKLNNDIEPITFPIDLNEDITLLQLIQRFNQSPQTPHMILYFVCGKTSPKFIDIVPFINFIKTTVQSNIEIVYRGYIHLNLLDIFLEFEKIHVNSNCQLIFDKNLVHDAIKSLTKNRSILQAFLGQFYFSKSSSIIDIDEVQSMGFTNIIKF